MIPAAAQRRLEASIPVGDRVLLDTTCLAAYLDSGEDVHAVARHILDAFVASGRNEAIVSMVTMMETIHRFRPPDALVVATGIACQVGHLITNDREWSTKLLPIKARIRVVTLVDFAVPKQP